MKHLILFACLFVVSAFSCDAAQAPELKPQTLGGMAERIGRGVVTAH